MLTGEGTGTKHCMTETLLFWFDPCAPYGAPAVRNTPEQSPEHCCAWSKKREGMCAGAAPRVLREQCGAARPPTPGTTCEGMYSSPKPSPIWMACIPDPSLRSSLLKKNMKLIYATQNAILIQIHLRGKYNQLKNEISEPGMRVRNALCGRAHALHSWSPGIYHRYRKQRNNRKQPEIQMCEIVLIPLIYFNVRYYT